MSQQPQTQQEPGESSEQTAELQRTLMENGRKAMRQFVELPLQQSLQFQHSAAELFVNGLEAQKWAQERGIELTKNTMGNYLQTLDDVTQNTEELVRTEMAAGRQQGQAIQQAVGRFQGGQEMHGQPPGGRQMGGQQPPGGQPMGGQGIGGQQTGGQQPIPQQPPRTGRQGVTGDFQQPQGQRPQGIGRQHPRPQGTGQQQPIQREGEQRPQPEPTEATQQSSRPEGQQAEGRTQQESPAETQ